MEPLKVLIVDDEAPARNNLMGLLQTYVTGIQVVGEADSAQQARELVSIQPVDALFLDVSMPGENGFELLESLPDNQYLYLFVTAHDQYVLRALRASAVDYLQKPLDVDELIRAVEKLKIQFAQKKQQVESRVEYGESLRNLMATVSGRKGVQRLCLHSTNGFTVVDVNDIVCLDADSNYTIFHLSSLKKIVVSKSIREYEDILHPDAFFRVHKSSIIHLKHLKEFSRVDGYYAIMSDGSSVAVSRRKLPEFIAAVESYNK